MLPPLLPFPLISVSSLHLLCLSFLSSSPTILILVSTSSLSLFPSLSASLVKGLIYLQKKFAVVIPTKNTTIMLKVKLN